MGRPSLEAAESVKLQLVAYNIKHGRGMDNKVDLRRIASVLRKLKPDLVALQEIDHNCLLYTSTSPRDRTRGRMTSSA